MWRFVPKDWCYPLYARNSRLKDLLGSYTDGNVLDYGCAGGKRFIELSQHGAKQIIGFDLKLDPEVMENRKAIMGVVQADGRGLPFRRNCFDTILANHVVEHIDDIRSVLQEICRTLRPGGALVLGIPTTSTISFYLYYPFAKALYRLFPCGTQIVSCARGMLFN